LSKDITGILIKYSGRTVFSVSPKIQYVSCRPLENLLQLFESWAMTDFIAADA
jgi:DNA-directed RNA polymerase beta' subunit